MLPQWVLNTKGGEVVANPYISSPSQQWNLESFDGGSWYIQNVASGRYLGLPIEEYASNFYKLREVNQKFAWHIKKYDNQWNQFLLHVPYTEFVICLDSGVSQPGTTVLYVHDNGGSHLAWYLYLHLEPSSVLKGGGIYKIHYANNPSAYITITVKDDHSGTDINRPKSLTLNMYDEGEKQMFKAVKTANGWAFQNVKTEQYLGFPPTTVYPDNSLRLSSVAMQFPWMVVPHPEGRGYFTWVVKFYPSDHMLMDATERIWLPFTQTVLRHDDRSWAISCAAYSQGTLWNFEKKTGVAGRKASPGNWRTTPW
ncbi:hypothetical protein BKA70DRAFT_1241536 [Coprinopsis sp. MPI-PUGE-AT-0042]|nr:hypothetical protein BKA70DRAFT_1241536 [Coprinopsis sp. MPI-PUGE-AT-0042]